MPETFSFTPVNTTEANLILGTSLSGFSQSGRTISITVSNNNQVINSTTIDPSITLGATESYLTGVFELGKASADAAGVPFKPVATFVSNTSSNAMSFTVDFSNGLASGEGFTQATISAGINTGANVAATTFVIGTLTRLGVGAVLGGPFGIGVAAALTVFGALSLVQTYTGKSFGDLIYEGLVNNANTLGHSMFNSDPTKPSTRNFAGSNIQLGKAFNQAAPVAGINSPNGTSQPLPPPPPPPVMSLPSTNVAAPPLPPVLIVKVDWKNKKITVRDLQANNTYGNPRTVVYQSATRLRAYVQAQGGIMNAYINDVDTKLKNLPVIGLIGGMTPAQFQQFIPPQLHNAPNPVTFANPATQSTSWVILNPTINNNTGFGTVVKFPLVLDLDDNGIDTTGIEESNIFFEYDIVGQKQQTGWSTDGFLVQDSNNNGIVDNASEFFGNSTQNGWEELRTIDSNGNGKIDAGDTAWNQLRIWKDTNQNGITDPGELKTLAEWNIRDINTNILFNSVDSLANGNTIWGMTYITSMT